MTANKQPLVLIGNEDRDFVDLADLFIAVDMPYNGMRFWAGAG